MTKMLEAPSLSRRASLRIRRGLENRKPKRGSEGRSSSFCTRREGPLASLIGWAAYRQPSIKVVWKRLGDTAGLSWPGGFSARLARGGLLGPTMELIAPTEIIEKCCFRAQRQSIVLYEEQAEIRWRSQAVQ